jgi:osmoprotectant transport system permease protein
MMLRILLPLTLILTSSFATAATKSVIGSKNFTESYILGAIAAQTLENASFPVERRFGLGGTGILFEALKAGAIDVYPEYTGTLTETILKKPHLKSIAEIKEALAPMGLTISGSLGFDDTYALAVKESFARKHDLHTISDLKKLAPKIRAAFSYEFMARKDGFGGLVRHYGLRFSPEKVKQMDHALVYQALNENAVDLAEVYSTDANIKKFDLRVLQDNRRYFPSYQAVWVARSAFATENPDAWLALIRLEGKIDREKMLAMNAEVDIEKKRPEDVAAGFLSSSRPRTWSFANQIERRTREHLNLVGIALVFSLAVGLPLGIVAASFEILGHAILLLSALIQTIPALALLCFLIPPFGIGLKPALVALCLYSLLPVVLNTFTGIRGIDKKHIENARAFGLSRVQILTRVVLPLASPVILAGIKTSTIVSIGTATLAALIGAGGYGALIISGLSLNDIPTILAGAGPAAAMALVATVLFNGLERLVVPRGLRI